jgi:hypothetical protein
MPQMCRSQAVEARGKSDMRNQALPIVMLVLALAACKQQASDAAPSPSETATPAGAAVPTAAAGQPRAVEESNDRYEFEYAYPAAAGAIPALKAKLDGDLAEQRAQLVAEANEAAADAKQNGYPYHPYSRTLDWKVVTELPNWLSLSTIVATYTGGAHPNYVFDALLWDKAANRPREALDLFTSKQALSAAISKAFCAAIDRQREEKRGEPVKRGSGEMFTECLDPVNYTIILGSSNGAAFDRIGFLVPPYEAGPYAEGSYEVTLPVTAQLLALVRPEFKASFAAAR